MIKQLEHLRSVIPGVKIGEKKAMDGCPINIWRKDLQKISGPLLKMNGSIIKSLNRSLT
jgi:hypothetical protein